MGSLMAGWDSHASDHDPKSVKLERNRSTTKEEIATFWRSKKNVDEEVRGVLKKACTFSDGDQKNGSDKIYSRSNSLPINTKQDFNIEEEEEEEEEEREKLFKKHGWWINSRWAFLNEPPVIASETPTGYATQFHVARKHIDDHN